MRIYILLLALLTHQYLWAQINPGDSLTYKSANPTFVKRDTVGLHEVLIYASDNETAEFSFYRSNKLATTEDLLSRMQGVNLIRRGAYGMEPALRGYSSGQTNITIDGMRIYGACTDKMDPVSIYVEPVNLRSVQVDHGASGAIAGSTIGGQINMQLKEPAIHCHKQVNARVTQSYASVNRGYSTSMWLQQNSRKMAYRVSGVYRKANDYRAAKNERIPYSGYEKANANAVLVWAIDSLQRLKVEYLGDWGTNIGYPALTMDVKSASAQIYAVTHTVQFGSKGSMRNESKCYFNKVTHQMDDTHRENIPMHMDMPGRSQTCGFSNELQVGEQVKVRADFHRVVTVAEMTMYPLNNPVMYLQTLPENEMQDAGLSAFYACRLPHAISLRINGRIDYIQQHALNGIGIQQWEVFNKDVRKQHSDLLKNLNIQTGKRLNGFYFIEASAGYCERIPTSNERYGYYLFNRQDGFDYMGNVDLKPEKSFQSEVHLRKEQKKLQLSLTLFYHYTANYIYSFRMDGFSQMTAGARGLKSYRNIQAAIMKGFEGMAKVNLSQGLEYAGSVRYVHATAADNIPLPLIPPFKLQHALRYEISGVTIQLEHDMCLPQNRVNESLGDQKTPGFNLLNIRVGKNLPLGLGALQMALAIENITDVRYREHLDIGSVPRPGRNVMVNLGYFF